MTVSFTWLKEYLDFDLTAEQIGEILTSIGLEVASIESRENIRGGLRGLVIGKVLTCEPHSNSDHLHVTKVDVGNGGEPLQIVCGAPNVAAGQTVVVATVGTSLYAEDGSEFKIKKSKIRGVESFGMICAADEIGVGHDHSGIMVLPDDVKAGTPAAGYFNVTTDTIIEIDITPNRVDATSIYGVARDLYAYLVTHGHHAELKRPVCEVHYGNEKPISVEVTAPEACLRYSGVVVKGIKVTESPEWLKKHLEAIGQKPINNVVDITNFVLFETGQPLHAFDLKYIKEGLKVRMANEGEKFTTLDHVECELTANDLVIADATHPLCLAGVMGGLESGVTMETTDIFFECATFHPTYVRKTARRHGLSTDSSFRFERGLAPTMTEYALDRAVALLAEIAGFDELSAKYDIYNTKEEPSRVELSSDYVTKLIGLEIPGDKIREILTALDIKITGDEGDLLHLEVPRFRYDVTRPADVVEEILRIYGYNEVPLPKQLVSHITPEGFTDRSVRRQQIISEQLVGAGFNEILNNSLSKESYYTEEESAALVRPLNPLSSDLGVLRKTMLYGGLETIAFNLNRKAAGVKIFEFGNTYQKVSENEDTPLKGYKETFTLALWMTGDNEGGNWSRPEHTASPFEMKAALYNVLYRLGLSPAEMSYEPLDEHKDIAIGETISLRGGSEVIRWGVLKNATLKKFDIPCPVYYAEMDWNVLLQRAEGRKLTINAIPKYPSVKRDFALLIDEHLTFDKVELVAYKAECKLLKGITLFDVYEDKAHLPEGKKSYAVTFELQDPERTLSDNDIDKAMKRIYNALHNELGAELR